MMNLDYDRKTDREFSKNSLYAQDFSATNEQKKKKIEQDPNELL